MHVISAFDFRLTDIPRLHLSASSQPGSPTDTGTEPYYVQSITMAAQRQNENFYELYRVSRLVSWIELVTPFLTMMQHWHDSGGYHR